MSKYTLFGETIEFSAADERYIKWHLSVFPAMHGATTAFESYYNECGNISSVLDGFEEALCEITAEWAVLPLFDTLINLDIYDISKERFAEECWDLSAADEYFEKITRAYNSIVEGLEDAKDYRSLRKASRGRVVGGGFGVGGALKGMATAGAMNAVTGLGHSIVNGIGNAVSSIEASSAKKSLYNSDDTFEALATGVRECIANIYIAYRDFINEYKNEDWFDGTNFDSERSNTLLENSEIVQPEKRTALLLQAFKLCPFNTKLLRHIFLNFEDDRVAIFKIAKNYRVNLHEELLEILCGEYCDDSSKICKAILDFEPDFDDDEKESILAAFCENASTELDDYEEILTKIHKIMELLEVDESEAFENYEYEVLDGIAEEYEDIPFGKADEIISAIVDCKVSDATKKEYIYDCDIWELFEKYEVEIPEDEKLILLYKKYHLMLELDTLSNEELKSHLDTVIEAINFKGKNGEISYDLKEAMFECLTGILEAKLKAQKDVNDLQNDLSLDITKTVEEIISNSGIGFMTTSLTYRQSSIRETSNNLSYCEIPENEYPFIVYDERPLMHPGKYGFCLTNKRFVGKPEYGARYDIPVSAISSFEKNGFLSSKFTLHTKNESIEINAENLSELAKFVDCLNKILKVIPQNEAKVNAKEVSLDKHVWIVSAQCLDEHPYLIDYFGMEEKADEIYEKSGKTAERKRILEECTDENLSVCPLTTLEGYLKSVKTLRIPEDVRTELCDKITSYIELIHSCKDKNTITLLNCCEESKINEYSYIELCTLRGDIENHEFLSAEKKQEILAIVIPRLNLLELQRKISDAGNKYDKLISIFSSLNNQPLSEEIIKQYSEELKERIIVVQTHHLKELTAGMDSMTHLQVKEAIMKIAYYDFDDSLLKQELKKLNDKLDEIERQVLSNFCDTIGSASILDITAFRDKLKNEEFKPENIALYNEQIDERYWTLVFEASCDDCKQTVISKIMPDSKRMLELLENFKNCGRSDEITHPYTERIKALIDIQKNYEQKKIAAISDGHNKLVSFVSDVIKNKVLPQTRECYKPEVYIQGHDSLKEYSEHDVCKELYSEGEQPVFFIFQLNGSNPPISNLSITNIAMYLSKNASNGQVIRIPLESITELKPARIFNEIAVSSVTGSGNIYSELPYKAKVCLASSIFEIVQFIVRARPQLKQPVSTAHNEYLQDIANCFENIPIPNDDEIVVNVPKSSTNTPTTNKPETVATNQKWVCKCGNTNSGNFCSACGNKKEVGNIEWMCSCGARNTANFCPSCGKARP